MVFNPTSQPKTRQAHTTKIMSDRPIRRTVSKSDLQRDPRVVWNAYVDLLATSAHAELTPVQRIPHLAFLYDNEVQNGGHWEYFQNQQLLFLDDTLAALEGLGAVNHRRLLIRAVAQLKRTGRRALRPADSHDVAVRDEFRGLDDEFCALAPTVTEFLERYLDRHKDEFVETPG